MKRLDIITAMPKNKHHRYLSQYHYHQQWCQTNPNIKHKRSQSYGTKTRLKSSAIFFSVGYTNCDKQLRVMTLGKFFTCIAEEVRTNNVHFAWTSLIKIIALHQYQYCVLPAIERLHFDHVKQTHPKHCSKVQLHKAKTASFRAELCAFWQCAFFFHGFAWLTASADSQPTVKGDCRHYFTTM